MGENVRGEIGPQTWFRISIHGAVLEPDEGRCGEGFHVGASARRNGADAFNHDERRELGDGTLELDGDRRVAGWISRFPNPNLAPHDPRGRFTFEAMHLKTDESTGRHGIFEVAYQDSVEPYLDRTAFADHAVMVPLSVLKGLPGLGIIHLAGRIQPRASTRFVINQAGIAVGRDFDLVTMDASVLEFRFALAPKLDARVES